MTHLIPFGPVGANGMANNIAFYVNGKSSVRADDIRIKININNPKERASAFSRLTNVTKTVVNAATEPVPAELAKALSQQKPVSLQTRFGRAELVSEPGRIDSFNVVLIDARHLAAKEQLRSRSVGDFESCKAVISRAVGYSASKLSGNGEPTTQAGYKSFLFKGRGGKDLFFCEVHSGHRYKVKAALDRHFPFKYIADGKF